MSIPATCCSTPPSAAARVTRNAPGPSCRSISMANPAARGRSPRSARARHLTIVQDACQAHGALSGGRPLAAYSFYPTKNLPCLGDGGAVLTDSAALAKRSANCAMAAAATTRSPASPHSMRGSMRCRPATCAPFCPGSPNWNAAATRLAPPLRCGARRLPGRRAAGAPRRLGLPPLCGARAPPRQVARAPRPHGIAQRHSLSRAAAFAARLRRCRREAAAICRWPSAPAERLSRCRCGRICPKARSRKSPRASGNSNPLLRDPHQVCDHQIPFLVEWSAPLPSRLRSTVRPPGTHRRVSPRSIQPPEAPQSRDCQPVNESTAIARSETWHRQRLHPAVLIPSRPVTPSGPPAPSPSPAA